MIHDIDCTAINYALNTVIYYLRQVMHMSLKSPREEEYSYWLVHIRELASYCNNYPKQRNRGFSWKAFFSIILLRLCHGSGSSIVVVYM